MEIVTFDQFDYLWNGKGVSLCNCKRKAYWTYRLGLVSKDINSKKNLIRGGYIHQVCSLANRLRIDKGMDQEQALGRALLAAKANPEFEHLDETQDNNLMMLHAWELLRQENVVVSEKPIYWKNFGKSLLTPITWIGKPDGIIQDPNTGDYWVMELKTTLRYGDAMRRLYYKELQPWLYFMILKNNYPEYTPLKGVRMFVAPPKGGIPPEDIPFTQERADNVYEFMEYATSEFIKWSEMVYNGLYPPKDRTKCTDLFGECQFYALCQKGAIERKDYFEGIIGSFFTQVNPMDHLKEE